MVPVELLCKFFTTALKSSSPSRLPSHLAPYHKNLVLLKITAVCAHWRLVASECATLWTNIAFSTSSPSAVKCATLFLARSKGALLSVHIFDSGNRRHPSSEHLLKMVASQSYRISGCELSSPSPEFWKNWSLPAPNLRKLTTNGHGTRIPPAFHGETPRLEVLTSLYHNPWPLGNYAFLKWAELRNHNHFVTLGSLLDALRGCGLLEKLILHGYSRLGNADRAPATLSLPRLGQLDLFSSDSALILGHLDAPTLKGPLIIFDSNPQQHILCSLPEPRHDTPYLQGITKLHAVLSSHSAQYYVVGYRGDGPPAFYVGVCGVGHWVRWTWVYESIKALATFTHFSDIRSLILSTDAPSVPWQMWLPNLSRVRELTVSCPRSEGLLTTLLRAPPEGGLPFCPSLSSLALFRCGRCAVVDHVSLMEFVLTRCRMRRPLRRLKLHRDDWDWIRELDRMWIALAQTECMSFRSRSTFHTLTRR
jgi:hypothetical protein